MAAVSVLIVLGWWMWSHSGWCNWQHKGKVEASTRQKWPRILAFHQNYPRMSTKSNITCRNSSQNLQNKSSKSLNNLLKWHENVQISCMCCPLVAQHPSIVWLTPSFVSPTTSSSTHAQKNNKNSESGWYFPTILEPPRPPLAIATSSHPYQSSPLGSLPSVCCNVMKSCRPNQQKWPLNCTKVLFVAIYEGKVPQ